MAESQWTIETLKELFTSQLDAAKAAHKADVELLKARLDAADEALKLQAKANEVHFTALNNEAGKIRVVGHTDSSPIKSVRFPSNWHLSLERAKAAKLVEQARGHALRLRMQHSVHDSMADGREIA